MALKSHYAIKIVLIILFSCFNFLIMIFNILDILVVMRVRIRLEYRTKDDNILDILVVMRVRIRLE